MNPARQCRDIQGYAELAALALDLHWSWSHCSDTIWQQLDPELWKLTRNPKVVLETVSRDVLQKNIADPQFQKMMEYAIQVRKQQLESPAWFQTAHPKSTLSSVAYFSMEYMLSEALPIYSGGLGNVAGDQLKAASDLGVPVSCVGLLYQQGYFRQMIGPDGSQEAYFPYNDPDELPITPVRKPDGEWLRIEIQLPGWSLWLRAWQVKVGRAKLYLLDSNDPVNYPAHRGITSELYGSGTELRLKQELILGIGGFRLLQALGIKPEVCHLNECHAAFVVLERARMFMQETIQSFETALAATRAGNLFTTHTAVQAGFDRFSPSLLQRYLGSYIEEQLKISFQDFLALGRQNPSDPNEEFNMAYLAIRGSGAINGVSRLHAEVSRQLFAPLFARWPEEEVPIGYVTNGVHMPSWDFSASDEVWTEACGKERWLGPTEALGEKVRGISDEAIWKMRHGGREALVLFAREKLQRQLAARGGRAKEIEIAKTIFHPDILTIGFARRFATYKRPDMLLSDPERLLRLLTNPARPVQLVLAGKAHPADVPGQDLLREWIQFIRRPEVRPHVVFLSDYDMFIAEKMVQGVDVWINTPRRPWEACGTSGMKVLVNGGLNCSELDGWWAEAYTPEVGWALGDGKEHGDDPAWDRREAEKLYDLLEQEVVPLFYTRDKNQMPTKWIARIRESMAQLTPHFSANRCVREYTEKYYIPAAKASLERTREKGAGGSQVAKWQKTLKQKWPGLQFLSAKVTTHDTAQEFEVRVNLNGLERQAVQVELYASGIDGKDPERVPMTYMGQPQANPSAALYQVSLPKARPAGDYTARIVPHNNTVAVPLEASEILWQR